MATEIVSTLSSTGTAGTPTNGGGQYTSFAAWQSAQEQDLVTNDAIAILECYEGTTVTGDWQADGSLDERISVGTAWVTGAGTGIIIRGAAGNRPTGIGEDGFRMKTAGGTSGVVYFLENYVTIDGIGVYNTDANSCVFWGNGRTNCSVLNCVITNLSTGADARCVRINISNADGLVVRNCVIESNGSGANAYALYVTGTINVAAPYIFQSNTMRSAGSGAAVQHDAGVNVHFVNNVVTNYGTGAAWSNSATAVVASNNASNDTTAPGTSPQTGVVKADFTDYDNGNNTPVNTGVLYQTGADLSVDFTTDILGDTRVAPWDIGAYEIAGAPAGPTIDTQPTSQTVTEPSAATFTVSATTSGGTLSYQWKDDGGNVGTDSATYNTGATSVSQTGSVITVDVTDDNGTTTSDGASILTVDEVLFPTIDVQPTSQTVTEPDAATFTVSATSSGGTLSYQWKDDGGNVGIDSSTYNTGATTTAQSGSVITVDVTDDNGTTPSDGNSTLTVNAAAGGDIISTLSSTGTAGTPVNGGGQYTSFAAWQAAQAQDLVTNDATAILECYEGTTVTGDWQADGSLDERLTVGTGWVTGADNRIIIRGAAGNRPDGIGENGFRLKTAGGTNGAVYFLENYVTLDGIGVYSTDANSCVNWGNGRNDCYVTNCAITNTSTGTDGRGIRLNIANGDDAVIRNCVIETSSTGVDSYALYIVGATNVNKPYIVENNTMKSSGSGGTVQHVSGANLHLINNVATNYGLGDAWTDNDTSIVANNNASNDVTAPGLFPRTGVVKNDFVDYDNGNYSSTTTGLLHQAGADLSAEFTTDILGVTRVAPWDIGAYESASTGPSPPTGVDAGGPYSGDQLSAIQLDGSYTPGTDPSPTLVWGIVSGGTGTFLPSAAVEDPTFTPDNAATYTLLFTVEPNDSDPVFDNATLTSAAAIVPIAFSGTIPSQDTNVGTAYTLDTSTYFSGSEVPFVYSVLSGTLPAGLSLNSVTGVISGTPTTEEAQSGIVVRGTDDAANTADSNSFSITVAAATTGGTFFYAMNEGSGSAIINTDPSTIGTGDGTWNDALDWTAVVDNNRSYPINEGTGATLADEIGGNDATIQNYTDNWG